MNQLYSRQDDTTCNIVLSAIVNMSDIHDTQCMYMFMCIQPDSQVCNNLNQCFCNVGFTGSDCSQITTGPTLSPGTGGPSMSFTNKYLDCIYWFELFPPPLSARDSMLACMLVFSGLGLGFGV